MAHDDGKVTTDDIRRALVSAYAQPEWHRTIIGSIHTTPELMEGNDEQAN